MALARVDYSLEGWGEKTPDFEPWATKLLMEEGPDAFERTFGTHYVALRKSSVTAMISITTERTEKMDTNATRMAMEAAYNGWGVNVSGSLGVNSQNANTSLSSKYTVKAEFEGLTNNGSTLTIDGQA